MRNLTAVIVAKDEASMIDGCLDRLGFADEIVVVVDQRTTDDTAFRANARGARVVFHEFSGFADLKNRGLDEATTHWVLIVDADERVTGALAAEIAAAISADSTPAGYRIPIANVFFGQRMHHGGWTGEEPVRLVRRGTARFQGQLHETLVFGDRELPGTLTSPLVHFSHRSILDSLAKTMAWADVQANELLARGHPPVTGRTLAKVATRELLWRLVRRSGWKDGTPGIIEALYQPLSLVAVYARLWELQQRPSLPELYRQMETDYR
ncbi:MAG: glycosyltransferase family 2 protein [Acidimicrobiales bacterium]